jgi:BMFP domain-containing protein YqiC
MVGGVGYAAGRAGARHSAQQQEQEQRISGLENQQQAAAPQAAAAPPPPAAGGESTVDQLQKLAQLRDSGVLTAEEFEAQKQKILAGGS